jgi:hypothetical protein
LKSNKDIEQTNDELVNRQFISLLTNKYQDQGKMKNKFNRQGNRFESREKSKGKGNAKLFQKGLPPVKKLSLLRRLISQTEEKLIGSH